jgi:hypothetical protein
MSISAAEERHSVAVRCFRPSWILAVPLALAGLVAATLAFAGKHEELLTRDTAAP